jgi:uncharacterized membrane protein YgcG
MLRRKLLGTLFLCLLFALTGVAAPLPRPIGQLCDYGNVLDRHGRERINALIEEAKSRSAIEVTILASWENPYEDIDRYSYALLDAWDLSRGKTLFAIFLKEGRNWQVRVLPGDQTVVAYPGLAASIEAGITDLVEHRRIEEAMVKFFSLLSVWISPTGDAAAPATDRSITALLSGLVVLVVLVTAVFFTSRRICPRCGHLLRVREDRAFGPRGTHDVIYYCRRCGYSRAKNRRGPGGRGG